MAKYDYSCPECESTVEVERSIKDPESAPTCSCGAQMVRIWNPTSAIFRGGGWGGQ